MIKIRRKIPEAWYCGSLIQQNHGETNDKGVLIWEIQDKDNFVVRPFQFKNPKPFISIILEEDGTVPEIDVPIGSRLRLVSVHPITRKQLQDAKEEARWRFDPLSIVQVDKSHRDQLSDDEALHYSQENLRDIEVQEELIYMHLKDRQLDADVFEKVLQINRDVEREIVYSDEIHRNVRWSINSFKWSNLFNYGEDNEIDFRNLNGLIGIFGKSYSGKSSVIDSILYTIFNGISKRSHRNVDFINNDRDECSAVIEITAGGKDYTIERSAKKYNRKGTTEAKGDVQFTSAGEKLNGLTRNDTDKNIRKVFGTVDDFKLTSMIPQFDAFAFINEGNTKRKEILAKYLDLEIFDEKHKLGANQADALKGALKLTKDIDYTQKIADAEARRTIILEEKDAGEANQLRREEHLATLTKELAVLKSKIVELPEGFSDNGSWKLLPAKIKNNHLDLESKQRELATLAPKLLNNESLLPQYERKLEKYVGERVVRRIAVALQGEIRSVARTLLTLDKDRIQANKESVLLREVPCADLFPGCKFIKEAHCSKGNLPILDERYQRLSVLRDRYEAQQKSVEGILDEVDNLKLKIQSIRSESVTTRYRTNELTKEIKELASVIEERKAIVAQHELYADSEDSRKDVEEKRKHIDSELALVREAKSWIQRQLIDAGICEGEIVYLKKERQQVVDRMVEYEAYELYLKCMHSNGIAYDIIRKKLPFLNREVEKILDGIVDFTIRFETDEKKLNIFICHQNQQPRIVTSGSGAEQTVAAIAITLALRMVTTLPQSDIFILDEPVGALDDDLKMNFVRLLEYIKSQFKTVFLITHLESLKDVVDKELSIEQSDGHARLVV